MKKSLIALTLAALPVAAMADVTLYGTIKAGVETSRSVAHNGAQAASVETGTGIVDLGSKIGFKGQEDLGNGLKAIWQVEQKASIAGTDSGWGNRQSFIGLKGGFGKLRVGRLNSVLKDTGDINPWDSKSDYLGVNKIAEPEARLISVRYDSPEFAGLSGSVQYALNDNAGRHNSESYHAGFNYKNGGFFMQYGGAYKRHQNVDNVKIEKYQIHRLVSGYDNDALYASVAVQQQDAKLVKDNSHNPQTEVAATLAYRFGNVTPRVSYAHGFKAKIKGKKDADTQYDQVIVGADYDFSKRTSALVSAGWLKEGKGDTKKTSTASMVGLRHKF
ncbi:trimeric porin PorB [Neisseria meningitidis]|uniref:trimeric porin PorB n=1 Tax=Neisseria meningitidis TaxID=487 RepID=UPI00068373FF|nr:trimeric porin PorB [Neisseria meningitidis]